MPPPTVDDPVAQIEPSEKMRHWTRFATKIVSALEKSLNPFPGFGLATATDDAALCERFNMKVVCVPGSERAMKITTEADFARAEALSILPE